MCTKWKYRLGRVLGHLPCTCTAPACSNPQHCWAILYVWIQLLLFWCLCVLWHACGNQRCCGHYSGVMCAMVCLWRSEFKLQKVLAFYHVGPRIWTQALRLGRRWLCTLSYLTSLFCLFTIFIFETESCSVAQASLELAAILLPEFLEILEMSHCTLLLSLRSTVF